MVINLMYIKAKSANEFCSWNYFGFACGPIDIKHLFLDRIQGCFDALEKRYVRIFLKLTPESKACLLFFIKRN